MAQKIQPAKTNGNAPKNEVKDPNATGSAAPGAAAPEGKKEKKAKRIEYPGLKDADGKPVKLEAVPADFDPKKHKPLPRKVFSKESVWYELKAQALELQAKKMRELGAEADKAGGTTNAGKAKKLLAMKKRMAELEAQLRAELGDEAFAALSDTVETK